MRNGLSRVSVKPMSRPSGLGLSALAWPSRGVAMAASLGAESERWCIVRVVVERDGSLVLVVEPTRAAVPCPQCGELSRRQHSRYERHPLDLPWRGKVVRMRVHSRRWFCDTPTCSRKIFAERFDGALPRYARRTDG